MTYEHSARADAVALPEGAKVSTARLRVVLRRLADHANEQGEAWPSAPTLAGQDMDEKTARNALAILEASGLIRKLGRGSRGYRFALCDGIVTGHLTRSESGQDARSSGPVTGRHIPYDRAAHPMRPGNTPGKTTKNQSGTTTSNGQHAPASNGATPRAVVAAGADALNGAGGFVGDLAEAAERLAALGVNGARDLARRAGSDRTVEWILERAHAPTVRDRAALAAKLIADRERPPASWKPRHERTRAPANPWERDAEARRQDWARQRAEDDAAEALIARHRDIADRAAASLVEGDGIDARTLRGKPRHEWAQHRIARSVVLAAIERETGERPRPAASRNGHAMHAQEANR